MTGAWPSYCLFGLLVCLFVFFFGLFPLDVYSKRIISFCSHSSIKAVIVACCIKETLTRKICSCSYHCKILHQNLEDTLSYKDIQVLSESADKDCGYSSSTSSSLDLLKMTSTHKKKKNKTSKVIQIYGATSHSLICITLVF